LPEATVAGQLWFDTCELAAMILVPREPLGDDWHPDAIRRWTPFVGWLSLRPVAVWQYRAFLALAKFRPREIASIHFKTYDPARIFDDDDEARPVTRLTCVEAKRFADWMGKQLPEQDMWQAARRIRPDAIERL
jgi:formylglycine-generating enzyme required for sulfatase activity